MNYTQGPWYAGNDLVNPITGTAMPSVGNAGHTVAAVESMDDARLIAAAPDLLAAAKRALPWIGKLIADGGHLQSVLPKDAEIALDQLQAAIYKATTPA